MKPFHLIPLLLLAGASYAAAQTLDAADSRGELLYENHCVACHTEQVHWRQQSLVTDWESLKRQVARWQAFSGLGWTPDDISAVARYINGLHYLYPQPD